jgi:hypothetical protein
MKVVRVLPFVLIAVVGITFWAAQAQQDVGAQAAKDCYEPAAPVEALMEAQREHSEKIKDLISAPAGDEEKEKTRFHDLEHQAYILAELGNVNRHQPNAKKKDYLDWATALRDQSVELAGIVAKKDLAAAKAQFKKIDDTCNACHEKYKDD